jgi:hypothetical protein
MGTIISLKEWSVREICAHAIFRSIMYTEKSCYVFLQNL